MYKMIIVDDESLIRTGLKNLIEWEVYGIEIAAEAEDGMSAYLAIKEYQPDIALIDITMPNMNGLELIELCSHLKQCPKFIILSGYHDFEYVRTAMKYGAVNYLLKPVDQEELTNTIMSTIRLLDDASVRKQQFQESIAALRNDILIRVLTNRIDNRELREKCRLVNFSFHCSNMRLAIIKSLWPEKEHSAESINSVATLCEQYCNKLCTTYTAIDSYDNLVLLFKDYSDTLSVEDYQKLLDDCSAKFMQKNASNTLTVLSRHAAGVSELSALYAESLNALEHQELLKNFFPKDIPETLAENQLPVFDYTNLVQILEKQDTCELKELLHKYFSLILRQSTLRDVDTVKYQLFEFIICIMQELRSSALSEMDIYTYKKEAFHMINTASSLSKIEEKLLQFFQNLMVQLSASTNPAYSPLVQNTLNYIKNNYHDDNLSLKTLANQLGVNAAYLGRQFSQETSEYFSDYLNRIRIARAVHLLKTTDWKTSVIATSVGFSNISYFFTIFKKITGGKPSDYRNSR